MSTRLCLVSPLADLAEAFEALGCEVWSCAPPLGSVLDLPAALARDGFVPDLVVQREQLAKPVLLAGLEELECPRMFWALDPHLNFFWHRHYAALFDLTLSTQHHLVENFVQAGLKAAWLPWFAPDKPWRPWSERSVVLGFAGRVTDHRPGRKLMVEHLKARFDMNHVQDLTLEEFFSFYLNTRLAPNESMSAEINFRLFETAGCGCLPLTQDLGPAQEELFAPGREMATYADVLELDDLILHYLKNRDRAEAMGRAARERARECHLPKHRAEAILDLARTASSHAAEDRKASLAWALARTNLLLSDKKDFPIPLLEAELTRLLPAPEALAALIRLLVEKGDKKKALGLVAVLLAKDNPEVVQNTPLLLAGSMAALGLDRLDWARQLYARCAEARGRTPRPSHDRISLLISWSEILTREGLVNREGFSFDPDKHMPATALECLLSALEPHGRDVDTYRRIDALLASIPGTDQLRLGILSHMSLHDRRNWRLALNLGMINLRTFRRAEGLEELSLAYALARDQGVEKRFVRALEARDRKGLAAGHVLPQPHP